MNNSSLSLKEKSKEINSRFQKEACFTTLALGKKYRKLASLLAKDIENHAPETYILILTDDPREFRNFTNVLAFKHYQQGVKCYHDKRFAIAKALQMFDSCIFIDADMRIIGEVPQQMKWLPGITARTGSNIIKHSRRNEKALMVIKKLGAKLHLNLEDVKFVHEFLFTVTKDAGKEILFLKEWDRLATYFELHKVYGGEGNAIGLAAAKAGLPVRFDSTDRFPFFKDRIELVRIKNGQVNPNDKLSYFEIQKKIENPRKTIFDKLKSKLINPAKEFYYLMRLRIIALKNIKFYQ